MFVVLQFYFLSLTPWTTISPSQLRARCRSFAVWKICAGALPWEALSVDSPAAVARAKLNAPAVCPFPAISSLIAESRQLPRFAMPPYNRLIESVGAQNVPAAPASASASASTSVPVSAPASAPRSTRKLIVSPTGAAAAESRASSSSSFSSSAVAVSESAPQVHRVSARKRTSGESVAIPTAAVSAATAAAHAGEDGSEVDGSAKRAKTSSLNRMCVIL
jgi:hypothetical protein